MEIPLTLAQAAVAAGFLGLLVGSFLNVVIHRLPIMLERAWTTAATEILAPDEGDQALPSEETTKPANTPFNLSRPRSACPNCGRQLAPWENIPVLSYLILRGRCGGCRTHISWRYPMVEAFTAGAFALATYVLGVHLSTLAALGMTAALIALAAIDFDCRLLPDEITLPLVWAGLLLNAWGNMGGGASVGFASAIDAVFGAACGYGSLWLASTAYRLTRGREGMGAGDYKLFAAIGAWLGWQVLPMVGLLAALSGILIGVIALITRGVGRDYHIPFGLYLATAGWIALLWGRQLHGLLNPGLFS